MPYLYKIPAPLTFLIGPLAFLYIRATIYKEKILFKSDWIHAIPFVIFSLNYLTFYFMPLKEKSTLVESVIEDMSLVYLNNDGLLPEWVNIYIRAILSIVYISLQWKMLRKFYKENTSDSLHFLKIKKWIYTFFYAQTGYWVALLIIYIFNGLTNYLELYNVPDFLSLSTLYIMSIFFFVLSGYLILNPEIMIGLNKNLSFSSNNLIGLNEKNQNDFFRTIDKVVRDNELYLNPNLNLAKVLVETGIAQRNIANTISNKGYNNFNSYINMYRIRLACEKLKSSQTGKYSIDAIAESCGFNSKNTFYRSFKLIMKTTPSEYIESFSKFK